MTTSSAFDTFYADVPVEQREHLQRFRSTHPMKKLSIDVIEWEYTAQGQGDQVVLLLVGALRVADAAFRSMPMLENGFRVITPSYPPVNTMAELCDGLAGIMAHEGVHQAHVLAGSFGGMLAQCFVRLHPHHVTSLILSTTTVLDSDAGDRYRQQAAALAPLPDELVRDGAKAQFLEMLAPLEIDRVFWRAYLDELFTNRLGKADLLSTLNCVIDFAEHYRFTADDLSGWPGRILILESDDDATFDAQRRAALHDLYPQARVHTFYGAGHSPGTTRREEYFALVRRFLNG